MRCAAGVAAVVAVTIASLTACNADIGASGASSGAGPVGSGAGAGPAPGGSGSGGGGVSSGGAASGDANAVGPRPLSRLTRREYNNTVRDLLGDSTRPADQFADDRERSFLFRRAGLVATQDAELLRSAAESLAAKVATDPSPVLPCSPAADEQACAAQFITTFGQRAYRRPLGAPEVTRLTALYTSARADLKQTFNEAIGTLVEAMLQSPAFLYHWESPYEAPTLESGALRLGPYDVASRLSYFVWGTMPDQELFDAAATGKLVADADVAAQARRMLLDDKAKDAVSAFFSEWLELDQIEQLPKDAGTYADYGDELKLAMVGETDAFVREVLFQSGGKLETLLSADFSFSNQTLSKVYGGAAAGTTLSRSMLDTSQRLGLLTHPSFLTLTGSPNGSNPVKRGKAVYEKLLCGELPPPPPNVPPAKPASAGGTTRERFAEHAQNACAKACHSLMDPIGFAFENYDGIGRFRELDNAQPVDASGSLTVDDQAHAFANARELIKVLATSTSVRSCFATQWFRFAVGRKETETDAPSLATIAAAFATNQFDIRDLAPAIAASRSFRYRSLAVGEVTP